MLLPFGLMFAAMGSFWFLSFAFRVVLSEIGLGPPVPQAAPNAGIFFLFLFGIVGAGHLAFGLYLFLILSVTVDRARNNVTVYSGLLGLWRKKGSLSDFQRVSIRPGSHFFGRWYFLGRDSYEIVLTDNQGAELAIGIVTLSRDRAHEVAKEVGEFTGLEYD